MKSLAATVHNFNAGPSILPREVFEEASRAILDFNETGLSILEIGHRTPLFEGVMKEAISLTKELMNLDSDHEVLFLHGGASTQFMQVPMNLLNDNEVAAYTETSIALFDAFISCWDEKFRSNCIRAETVINKYIDENWHPYIQTPPFPSYTSGHATISAAAAEVMTKWFGDHLSFIDTSSLEFGIQSRRIESFRQAAKEAAMSRLYGGIHFRFDNDEGNKCGRMLGEFVVQKLKMSKELLAAKN